MRQSLIASSIGFILIGLVAGAPAEALPSQPKYTIQDLAPGWAWRINNQGEVSGIVYFQLPGQVFVPHAAVYRSGTWHDYGTLAGDTSSGLYGINNQGEAVGYSNATFGFVDSRYRAIVSPGGPVAELSAIPQDSWAYGINDTGRIVGCRNRQDDAFPDPQRAYVYDDGGASLIDLHVLLSGALGAPVNASCAQDVNSPGDVVGYVDRGPAGNRGFVYRHDGGIQLLEGTTRDGRAGYLFGTSAVNDSGRVVGVGHLDGASLFGREAALAFDLSTGMLEDLGAIDLGGFASLAYDVNSHGDAVGYLTLQYPGGDRAFLEKDGTTYDLNALIPPDSGWVLQAALGINDSGQIVGRGNLGYFLLNPVVNQPPTVTLGGPYALNEGGAATIVASATDPEAGSLTFDWDLDGDGAYETLDAGSSVAISASSDDGPSTWTIAVRVTDEGNLTAASTASVSIVNVAPTATLTMSPSRVYVGEVAIATFSGEIDPSAADTAAGFSYAYDCAADATFDGPASPASSHPCTYALAGVQTALGRIQDKDGGFRDYTAVVTVVSPRQGIEGLIQQVTDLRAAGLLSDGEANSLTAKLEAALKQLEKSNVGTVANQLNAFLNELDALVRSGRLPAVVAQPLIDETRRILAALVG